jgi:hypothetical protein
LGREDALLRIDGRKAPRVVFLPPGILAARGGEIVGTKERNHVRAHLKSAVAGTFLLGMVTAALAGMAETIAMHCRGTLGERAMRG